MFQSSIVAQSFNEKAYLLLGELFLTKKDFDKAIGVYDEAIEINPNFAQAYHERGRIKLLKGDKDGSVEDMKRLWNWLPKQKETSVGNITITRT